MRRFAGVVLAAAFTVTAHAQGVPPGVSTATEAAPGSPTQQMRDYTAEVLRAIQEAALQEGDRVRAGRLAARKVAIQVFGLAEAAQEALGAHWEARTPAEREEFIQLFADLLEAAYIAQLDKQQGLRMRYVGETVEGDRATVRARLITRRGNESILEARLARREGRWLVLDVSLGGIGLVANFRSQFDRIIRRSSYQGLVQTLRAKRDELGGSRGRRE